MQNNNMNNNMDRSANPSMPQKKENFKDKAGDMIEKAGHKISDMGAPKVGQKIHDLGDSLEEKHDNPDHPHKV